MKSNLILTMVLTLFLIISITLCLISCYPTTLNENTAEDTTTQDIATETISETKTTEIETVFNISIANGSGVSGLAKKTAELFKTIKYHSGIDKYNITHITNADNFNHENTKIICKSEDTLLANAAEDIKTILKAGIITTSNEVSKDTDIAIIIGKDYSLHTDVETTTTITTNKEELTSELEIAEANLEEKDSVNLQNKVSIEYEVQDIYYDERKVVVWVKNNSNKNFSGYIECEFYNHKGELIWQDWSSPTWDFEFTIPPGQNSYCIMFIPIEKGFPSRLQYVIKNPNFY